MSAKKNLQFKYDHALLAMFDLFKAQTEENQRLEGKIEMLKREIIEIHDSVGVCEPARVICDRALNAINL